MIIRFIKILVTLSLLLSTINTIAQEDVKNRILFIFDASKSMSVKWDSKSKFDISKDMLTKMLDSIQEIKNLEIGLRIYGHLKEYPPQDCNDSRLEVDFLPAKISTRQIKAKLNMIKPRGTTPIGMSLEEGIKDFPDNNARNIVVIITDGEEECDMDPCAVSRLYQRKGIILKPFIIGVGPNAKWKESLDCVGKFLNAEKEEQFTDILNIVISNVLHNSSIQVNLLDEKNEPTETNINLTFYNEFTNMVEYNYVHTMNQYGHPDTMIIDPIISYKLVANTIPPTTLENINIKPGKHTIIPLKTPQGELKIEIDSKKDYKYIIKEAGTENIVHVETINKVQKYIAGKYDIEVLTLPRKKFYNVEIKQSSTTKYIIPSPSNVNIMLPSKGYGGLYLRDGDYLEEIYTFNGDKLTHKLNLLPGNYKIVFRDRYAKKYNFTSERNFNVKSRKTKNIKL